MMTLDLYNSEHYRAILW